METRAKLILPFQMALIGVLSLRRTKVSIVASGYKEYPWTDLLQKTGGSLCLHGKSLATTSKLAIGTIAVLVFLRIWRVRRRMSGAISRWSFTSRRETPMAQTWMT